MTTPILTDTDNFFNNDIIMSSLLKRLSILIKIHAVKQLWSLASFQIVDRIRRQSSWASCELCSHRLRDETVSSRQRRRCVLSISLLGCLQADLDRRSVGLVHALTGQVTRVNFHNGFVMMTAL